MLEKRWKSFSTLPTLEIDPTDFHIPTATTTTTRINNPLKQAC